MRLRIIAIFYHSITNDANFYPIEAKSYEDIYLIVEASSLLIRAEQYVQRYRDSE